MTHPILSSDYYLYTPYTSGYVHILNVCTPYTGRYTVISHLYTSRIRTGGYGHILLLYNLFFC